MADVEQDLLLAEALNGSPDFLDIPEELQAQIEKQVEAKERMFWLRSNRIHQDIVTRSLLRRAIYAETRAIEMESRLAEMVLITQGAKERVQELEQGLKDLAEATS